MENQLFSYEKSCDLNRDELIFYDLTLIVPIDGFPFGATFEEGVVNYRRGYMILWKDHQQYNFKLNISTDKIWVIHRSIDEHIIEIDGGFERSKQRRK